MFLEEEQAEVGVAAFLCELTLHTFYGDTEEEGDEVFVA